MALEYPELQDHRLSSSWSYHSLTRQQLPLYRDIILTEEVEISGLLYNSPSTLFSKTKICRWPRLLDVENDIVHSTDAWITLIRECLVGCLPDNLLVLRHSVDTNGLQERWVCVESLELPCRLMMWDWRCECLKDTYDDAEWRGEEVESCVWDTSGLFGLVLNCLEEVRW